MKLSAKSFAQLIVGTSVGCLFSSILAQPSISLPLTQTQTVDPLQDFKYQRSSNPFGSANQGDNFGVLDLVRNAVRASKNSSDGYTGDQGQNLDDAAAQFRVKQQQLIQPRSPQLIQR